LKVKFELPKQVSPTVDRNIELSYGAALRGGYRLRRLLLLLIVMAPVVYALFVYIKPKVLTIAPGVVTYQVINVMAPKASQISKVLVSPGQLVEEGTVLIQLRDESLESELAFLEQELQRLKQHIKTRDQSILTTYENKRKKSQSNYHEMLKIKEKYDKYLDVDYIGSSEYAVILSQYSAVRELYDRAELDLHYATIKQADEWLIGETASLIRNLERTLVLKRAQWDALSVKTPVTGLVIDMSVNMGKQVSSGQYLIKIVRKEQKAGVIAYLDSKYVAKAQLGDNVRVKLPNGDTLRAEVSSPTKLASKLPQHLAKPFEQQRALMQVTLSFNDAAYQQEMFIEGMPVEVYF